MAGPVHALQTLRKIDAMIEADQGSAYRGWLGRVLPHIGDAYRTDEDGFRSHLGASVLGGECARAIWLGFRWASKAKFDGRILRLFNRGHLEEGRVIAALLMVGAQVYQQDENGKQFRISWAGGHAGGSGDGVALGIPDLVHDMPCLLEFKTHGEKSFIELSGKLAEWRKYVEGKGPFTGKGLKAVKPEHYIQMQVYMKKMGIAVGLYVAVCKNTDDLYMELVALDSELAEQFMYRGEQIVFANRAPAKINESAGFFKCVFCNERPVCQLGVDPAVNCRTCQFSEPLADGSWLCNKHSMALPKEKQLVGCPDWYRNDDL